MWTNTLTDRFITIRDVCGLTSLSRSTVWRATRDGAFPMPIRLTPGRVAWSEKAVLGWIQQRLGNQATDALIERVGS